MSKKGVSRIRSESGHARSKRKKERELLEAAKSSKKIHNFFSTQSMCDIINFESEP